jgi:hypothetical protein
MAFATALLSPPVTAWIGERGFSALGFVFTLPVLVFVVPLLIFALILSDNDHRRFAVTIFSSGMILYLGYAIYTLSGELMASLIGNIYVPSIIFMTPFSLYAICHQASKIEIKKPNKPHHPTPRSRPVSMISRNYNTNPVIHARPRS